MTTENLIPSDHRQALQQLLRTARAPSGLRPSGRLVCISPTAAAAIEWALDQTQEPAPPPGGWGENMPAPAACIAMLEAFRSMTHGGRWDESGAYPPPTLTNLAIQWALPILRRAANLTNLTQNGPIQKPDPEKPVGTPSPNSFPILTRWLDLCNTPAEWVTIIQGNSPPQNVTPYDIVPTIDLKAEILAATGPNPEPEDRHLQTPLDVEPMTLENCLLSLRVLAHHPNIQSRHRRALKWALDRFLGAASRPKIRGAIRETSHPTDFRQSSEDPAMLTTEAIAVLEAALEAAILQETGSGEPKPPKPGHLRIALEWALSIIRSPSQPPSRQIPETKTEDATHEWIPALAALARRELRFWKETGEVSGTVTRRAASRAIRGLEQIIKTIPANLRDS